MRGETTTAGIGIGVLAYGLFALHDAAVKALVADLPVWQVLFFRSASILAACLMIGRRALLERAAATPLKQKLFWRSVINLTAWLCYYSAARTLPLAQLLCLYFAAPLMVTLMARRILRETVTRARWLSVVVGFLGVLCASDPFGLRFSFATGLVLLAAALWGYGIILMRQIAGQEPALLQMLASNTVFLTGTGLACLVEWHPLSQAQFLGLIGVAVIGGLAQFLVFEAARLIQASIMATVEYSALPWAFFLGWWFWGDIPPVAVFAGAGLILLAGGILIRGERRA